MAVNVTPAERVKAARERVAMLCPPVRVGDVYAAVHGDKRLKVVAFKELEEDAAGEFPWPLVVFEQGKRTIEWGLPSLIGCTRLRAGRGLQWAPPVAVPARMARRARAAMMIEARQAAKEATAALRKAVSKTKGKRA